MRKTRSLLAIRNPTAWAQSVLGFFPSTPSEFNILLHLTESHLIARTRFFYEAEVLSLTIVELATAEPGFNKFRDRYERRGGLQCSTSGKVKGKKRHGGPGGRGRGRRKRS